MYNPLDLLFIFLEYTDYFRSEIQKAWTVALALACLRWGGGPERASAIVWTAVTIPAGVIRSINRGSEPSGDAYWTLEPTLFVADGILFVGFFAIALTANRQYVLWIAAFQLIALSSHIIRVLSESMTPFTYIFMTVAAGWMQVFILTYALIAHIRRESGRYADWSKEITLN